MRQTITVKRAELPSGRYRTTLRKFITDKLKNVKMAGQYDMLARRCSSMDNRWEVFLLVLETYKEGDNEEEAE